MADLIVYGARYSTYTRSVLLALAEKNVPFVLEEVDIFGAAPPGYLERHPFGRIPALDHDGFQLYETGAILRYVDEAFAGPPLQPADRRSRARMSQIIGIIDSYVYRAMIWDIYVERSRGVSEPGTPDEARIAAAVPRAATCLAAIASLMSESAHLAGVAPTLADLHLVPMLAYFRLTPEGQRLIAGAPAIARWWDAMAARPSVVATRFQRELA